jgi:hypothetical protein
MFNSIISGGITATSFLLCTAVSVVLGILTALVFMYRNKVTPSFAITLAVIPAVVQLIIMLVNGNIGTGLAIAGAFGLVRFRSVPGRGREIASIFLSMALGLATGMGYLAVAAVFFVIMAAISLLLTAINFGSVGDNVKTLRITIPENLDYEGLFDDLLKQYTKSAKLESVRTTNMGTLFELSYAITLKSAKIPKELLDGIRSRNGNLNVLCSKVADEELM